MQDNDSLAAFIDQIVAMQLLGNLMTDWRI